MGNGAVGNNIGGYKEKNMGHVWSLKNVTYNIFIV